MIIVDTPVWIDHLHQTVPLLVDVLESGEVLTHPFVIGELACGQIRNRRQLLDLLKELPTAIAANEDEVLRLIDDRRLMGQGLGYIDIHLLAASMLTGAPLWTTDKRLRTAAAQLRIGFERA
jgi:predicted nucleic acid-binding protein